MAPSVKAGDKAPDFTLLSQAGEPVRLSDRLGERVVILYFYPKADTPGCTTQACGLRDILGDIGDTAVHVHIRIRLRSNIIIRFGGPEDVCVS